MLFAFHVRLSRDFLFGRIINRSVGSLVKNDHSQLKASFTLLRKPISGMMWMNSQISHAKNPPKDTFGKSATALYFEMMAIEPLSLYLNGLSASPEASCLRLLP